LDPWANHWCLTSPMTEILFFRNALGFAVNCTDGYGRTPLHYACLTNNKVLVSFFLWLGCDLEIKDKKGSTPLFRAAELGHTEIVHLLMNRNANIFSKNHNMETPLFIACLKGRTETVKLFLSKISTELLSNSNDYHDGWTPTHAAVIGQHHEILKLLIQYKVLLDYPNRYGHTPLHIAVRKGFLESATILISANVDLTNGEPLDAIIAQKKY